MRYISTTWLFFKNLYEVENHCILKMYLFRDAFCVDVLTLSLGMHHVAAQIHV
jgi:hypothetical protein